MAVETRGHEFLAVRRIKASLGRVHRGNRPYCHQGGDEASG
jgi:hypothetical protein